MDLAGAGPPGSARARRPAAESGPCQPFRRALSFSCRPGLARRGTAEDRRRAPTNRTALFTIFLAQWLGLFGENLVVARLPSLIAGVALVVLVFLWTRTVAGNLAAVLAALLLALDPENVQISQFARFYALHALLFWLGAVGTYRLVTSPPAGSRPVGHARGRRFCSVSALRSICRSPP